MAAEELNEAETKEIEELELDALRVAETAPTPKPEPVFKIESLKDLQNMLTIARGGDPDAIQAVAQFMNMRSNIERSYFPEKIISIVVAQLTGYGKTFFPKESWDPFSMIADCLSIAFMPYKGFKSNQFVDMTRQTPDLSDLQTVAEQSPSGGLLSRITGRGKTE